MAMEHMTPEEKKAAMAARKQASAAKKAAAEAEKQKKRDDKAAKRDAKEAEQAAKKTDKAAKQAEKERIMREKAAAAQTGRTRREAPRSKFSEEELLQRAKTRQAENKDKYNYARLMKRHSTGESVFFNRGSAVKYEIPIDGKIVKDFDATKVMSTQMRGAARDPLFEHNVEPEPEAILTPGKPISYVELLKWLVVNHKEKTSQVKCFFESVVPQFGEISNIYDVINDTKLVQEKLQLRVNKKELKITSLRGYYATGLWLTSHPAEVSGHNIHNKTKDFYLAKCSPKGEIANEIAAYTEDMTSNPKYALPKWELILKRMQTVYGPDSPEMLYLKIYEDVPVRNDLGTVRVVDYNYKAVNGGNFLVKYDDLKKDERGNATLSPYLYLQSFKTGKHYGYIRGDLSPNSQKIILDDLRRLPRQYLFCAKNTTNVAFGDSLSARMTKALREAGLGNNLTCPKLRNAYATYLNEQDKNLTHDERVTRARKFGHNTTTAPKYIRAMKEVSRDTHGSVFDEFIIREGEEEVEQKYRTPHVNAPRAARPRVPTVAEVMEARAANGVASAAADRPHGKSTHTDRVRAEEADAKFHALHDALDAAGRRRFDAAVEKDVLERRKVELVIPKPRPKPAVKAVRPPELPPVREGGWTIVEGTSRRGRAQKQAGDWWMH